MDPKLIISFEHRDLVKTNSAFRSCDLYCHWSIKYSQATVSANQSLSLPDYIDNNEVELRKRYIKFSSSFLDSISNEMRSFYNVDLIPTWVFGFNFVNNSKSVDYNQADLVKIFALDSLVDSTKFHIEILGRPNLRQIELIRVWARWKRLKVDVSDFSWSLKKWIEKNFFLTCCHSAISLTKFIISLFVLSLFPKIELKKDSKVLLVSYSLLHENRDVYWGHSKFLEDVFDDSYQSIYLIGNWDFGFKFFSKIFSNANLVEREINLKMLVRIVVEWWRWFRRIDRRMLNASFSNCSEPYLRDYLNMSVLKFKYGFGLFKSVLYKEVFASLFSRASDDMVLIYSWENQAWEFSMREAWNDAQCGPIVGYNHTVTRFWDLRYCLNMRPIVRSDIRDLFAVNGALSTEILAEMGSVDFWRIRVVEALRFFWSRSGDDSISSSGKNRFTDGGKTALVLGDYSREINRDLSDYIEELVREGVAVVIKPHPARGLTGFETITDRVNVMLDWELIFAEYRDRHLIAVASCSTAAVIDATLRQIPVITIADPRTLNDSPLKGLKHMVFIHSPDEVVASFYLADSFSVENAEKLFLFDDDLSGWRRLKDEVLTFG